MKSPRPPGTRRAFTLIELLAVIAIIGLLTAILIPSLAAVRASARDTRCLGNLRQIGIALNLYRGEHKGLPPPPLNAFPGKETTYENRTAWEGASIGAVGLARLQYDGFLGGPAAVAVTGDARSPLFHCPDRDSGNGWAYAYPNWIDYSYLLTGDRYVPVLDPGTAIATDVAGGKNQKAGAPVHGDKANVAYVDGSVSKLAYALYSTPDRTAETFDRRSR